MSSKDPAASTTGGDAGPLVPWERIVLFNRRLSHDVRNGLNALDLEAAFIAELNTDQEIAEELKKLRAMVVNITKTLHGVTSFMGAFPINSIRLEASLLLRELRERLTKSYPKEMPEVAWSESGGGEAVEVDVERFMEAMREIFDNAFVFREKDQPISFNARCEAGRLALELREGKSGPVSTAEWSIPFVTTRRGGYGLGLFHARRVLAAHDGEWCCSQDGEGSTLVTKVSLPLAKE